MDGTLIVVALIGAVPSMLAAVAALLAWRKAGQVNDGVRTMRVELNHRLDEHLAAAGKAGELRGRDAERADPRLEEG